MAKMITLDAALDRIARNVEALGLETIALPQAAGRVLGEPLFAPCDSPQTAVAAMDGYAVLDAHTVANVWMQVIGESWAGRGFEGQVGPGEAVRVFTGAQMPAGADRCIMQEYATRDGDRIRFATGYGPKWHVRAAGSYFSKGDRLLDRGQVLTPNAMVAAAATDRSEILVALRPKVSVIGTGDELAPPGSAADRPFAIPESVTFAVAAMASALGGAVIERRTAGDDLPLLEAIAGELLDSSDLVVVTGGASVGDRDFAKAMFARLGLKLLFEKVAIKPGKPVWMGTANGKWVIGLPGNPHAAMVTATLILRPVLAALLGRPATSVLCWRTLPLAEVLMPIGARETFVQAIWGPDGLIPIPNKDSGAQAAMARADWLIRCPAGMERTEAGEMVTALHF